MGVTAGHREAAVGVVLHILRHGSVGLIGPLHNGAVVIVRRGQHVVAGKEEDGCKTEQCKVHAVAAGVGEHRVQAVGRGGRAEQEDGKGHIAVDRLALELGALAALGSTELIGKLGLCVQILLCPAQDRHGVFGIVRQLRQLAGGLFLGLFLQRLLPGGTQQPNLGLLLCQQLQQGIHVPLVLEVALLLFAAIVLHHKVSHGGKHSLAGKAARTHGHPLEHTGDAGVGQVVAAVDVKAVQIQGFFAHAAGADLFTGFPVSRQLGGVEPGKAQLCRFEEHNVHPSFAFLFVPIFPLRQRKCKAQPALLAKNRKPAAELTAAGLFY